MLPVDAYPGAIPDDPAEILRLLETADGKRYPHALFNRLREVAPVYRDPHTGVIYASRWADADHVFRSARFGGQEGRLQADPRFETSDALQLIAANLAFRDPPEQTRLRLYAQKAFSRPVIEGMRTYLHQLTAEVLDGLSQRDEFDIVNDFAIRIPPTVICHMLGIPTADRVKFEGWVADQFRLLSPVAIPDEVLAEVNVSTRKLVAYTTELIEQRRREPNNDLVSGLINARDAKGQAMTPHELIAMTLVLLAGGSDTTRFVIAMGSRGLLLDPAQGDLLRADPRLEALAFEEFCRLYGPVMVGNLRQSYDDTPLGDVAVKAGEWVAPVIIAANLDPAMFTDPLSLDITRQPNPHQAFGGGAHMCLGIMLARMIGSHAIAAFARQFPRLQLVDAGLDVNMHLPALRGLNSLRVKRV